MLVLRLSNFQRATINRYFLDRIMFTTKFCSAPQFKLILNYFHLLDESCQSKLEKKTDKTPFNSMLTVYFKPACLQKHFHGRALSIRVFSSDWALWFTLTT